MIVAAVGDSITELSGWPDQLGAELGAAYTVHDYGLAGTTLLKNGDHPYWAMTAAAGLAPVLHPW